MATYEETKKANRLAQARFRQTEKGKEYMAKWRAENRERYLEYQREQAKKRRELVNVSKNQ